MVKRRFDGSRRIILIELGVIVILKELDTTGLVGSGESPAKFGRI